KRMSLTGNEAAAWGGRCANVRVGSSFPMGPNMEVTETLDRNSMPGMRFPSGGQAYSQGYLRVDPQRHGVWPKLWWWEV
ncbi:MAG: hypothetical protein JRI85_13935, partial [Deltaproteobacteria bacterium]|nr:hypothetical protein [Deltaproteobacteria bacterium]